MEPHKYSDYLSEKLNRDISYSEYIKESLDKDIDYAEYIAENLNQQISYSEYIEEDWQLKKKIKEREAKIDDLLNED